MTVQSESLEEKDQSRRSRGIVPLISMNARLRTPIVLADGLAPEDPFLVAKIIQDLLTSRADVRADLCVAFEWPQEDLESARVIGSDALEAKALTVQRQVWQVVQKNGVTKFAFPKSRPPLSMFRDPWPAPDENVDKKDRPGESIRWWFSMARMFLDNRIPAKSLVVTSPWTAADRGINESFRHLNAPRTKVVSIFTGRQVPVSCVTGAARFTFNVY